MGEVWLDGEPPIAITVRRSARARRYSLRISRLDGRVTLTVPKRASERDAIAFAREQRGWLDKQLATQSPAVSVTIGVQIPVEGRLARVVGVPDRRGALMGDLIEVPERTEAPGAHVEGLLKAYARDRLVASSEHYALQIGRKFSRITLRDTRSRWGSCSAAGSLMYSWRLIMAPPEVLNYVAAHEVAHLREMNHSNRFWGLVADICPDYEHHRAWLRSEGAELHRYRFRD